MTDTTIHLANIAIHEPVTVFTDVIIALLCFLFYSRLPKSDAGTKRWRLFFFFFGLSTLIGSCSHAFFEVHVGLLYKLFWIPMQLLNGLAVFFAETATLETLLRGKKKMLSAVFFTQLLIFCLAVFFFQNFLVVVINNAAGLIPVMVIHFMNARNNAGRLIGYGILISFLTGFVHGFKLSLSAYFNYNDIAHVLIMISLSVMFTGVLRSQPKNTRL